MARLLLRLSLVALALALALTGALQLRMPRELVEVFALPDNVLGVLPSETPAHSTPVSSSVLPATSTPAPVASGKPVTVILQTGRDGYSGCSDTFVQFYLPDDNFCRAGELYVVTTDKAAALLRFDLSQLPSSVEGLSSGAAVVEAKLELYAVQGNQGVNLGMYLPDRSWDGCTITWNKPWEKPGANGLADRDLEPLQVVVTKAAPERVEFDMTALVQAWLRDPDSNSGVLIKSFEATVPSHHIFFSSEAGDSDGRPRLTIRYEPALPAPTLTHTSAATPTVTTPSTATVTSTPVPPATLTMVPTPTYIVPGSPRVVEVHWWNQMDVGQIYPVKLVFRAASAAVEPSSFDVYVLGVNAQLSASTFDVVAESPSQQVLTEPEAALVWSWDLLPRFTGEQSISLDLLFDWTPASLGQPSVLTEPGAWYQTRTTKVNKAFPYWSVVKVTRAALVLLGALCWVAWFALRKRRSQS